MPSSLPEEHDTLPSFAISVFNDGEGDVTFLVHVPDDPSIKRHASPALLYGLAILTLDKEGAVSDAFDLLLQDGPINEVDATNRINVLLAESEIADGH